MSSDEGTGASGMFARLKAGLSRSASAFSGGLVGLLTKQRLDAVSLEMLVEALIRSDVGAGLAQRLAAEVGEGRYDAEISTYEVRALAADAITNVLKKAETPFRVDASKTLCGSGRRRQRHRQDDNHRQACGQAARGGRASHSRRAHISRCRHRSAQIWGERAHADVIARAQFPVCGLGVRAFEPRQNKVDVLLIDTAGRLQNKAGLMAELEKIARVLKKVDTEAPLRCCLCSTPPPDKTRFRRSKPSRQRADRPHHDQARRHREGRHPGGACRPLQTSHHFVGVGEPAICNPSIPAFAKALTGT
jgi:fused signal recognition particle receptor